MAPPVVPPINPHAAASPAILPRNAALKLRMQLDGEEAFSEGEIKPKWLKRPLLQVAIAPYLRHLQASRPQDANKYQLPLVGKAECNGMLIRLNVMKHEVTIHSPVREVATLVGAGGQEPLICVLGLHSEEEHALESIAYRLKCDGECGAKFSLWDTMLTDFENDDYCASCAQKLSEGIRTKLQRVPVMDRCKRVVAEQPPPGEAAKPNFQVASKGKTSTFSAVADGPPPKPKFLARMSRFLMAGSGSGSAVLHVSVGGFALQTELSAKWLRRPAWEAIVEPFLEAYNASNMPGTQQKLKVADVVGLRIDGVAMGKAALMQPPAELVGAKLGTSQPISVALVLEGFDTSQEEAAGTEPELSAVFEPAAAALNTAEINFGIEGLTLHEFDDLIEELQFTPRNGYALTTPR